MRYYALLLAGVLLFVGHGVGYAQPADAPEVSTERRAIPYPITPDRAFQRAVARGTRTETGAPGPNYWTNTAEYDLAATIDPETNQLRGSGEIHYHNNSPDTLRQVIVHLRQNIHKEGAMRNRSAEVTGGMSVDRIAVNGERLQGATSVRQIRRRGQGYLVQDTRMIVVLPSALRPDASTTLSVDWQFEIPGADNFRMGQDGEVYYLGYWYPHLAVYDDVNGWSAQPYLGDGEFYMGYADYDVSITVPEGWLVGATGTLQNGDAVLTPTTQERLARARSADSVVTVVGRSERGAGSATVEASAGDSTLTWQFAAERVRDFAFGTSDAFVWDATHAETGEGAAMIHALYRPGKSTWARSAEFARFSVEHLSDMILPYPDPQMTTVEGPIGGGMEYPMITHIGSGQSARGLFGVTYHEISHMWFPMLVGTNEKAYAWLDEGTTTFNETEGRNAFFEDANAWARSEHYYFRFAPTVQTPSMRHADRYPVEGADRYVASYDKPGVMLHALRGVLGEETFFEAYRTYAERWAYKHPTPYDFFNTFEDVAGRELDWFWRGTIYETWTMDQAVASVETSGDSVQVTVEDRGQLPMPVLLEAQYEDGRTVERRVSVDPWLEGRRTVTVALPSGPLRRVVIDPEKVLPEMDRSNNTWRAAEEAATSGP